MNTILYSTKVKEYPPDVKMYKFTDYEIYVPIRDGKRTVFYFNWMKIFLT